MLYRLSYSLGNNPTEAGIGSNRTERRTERRIIRPRENAARKMPERGLEPPPSYLDKNLNLARLPIPPLGRVRPLERQAFDATNARPGRK